MATRRTTRGRTTPRTTRRTSSRAPRRRRSPARRRRRVSDRRTIPLPGGFKVNVGSKTISISGKKGPVTQTVSSTGRRTTTIRLPGGFTWRRTS